MAFNPLNIMFVASEVEGFAKTGGLADVAKALPLALQKKGHQVAIFMPFYRTLNHREEARQIASCTFHPDYGLAAIPFRIYQSSLQDVPIYFLDCPHYFDRASLYGENNQAYCDNGERFTFFSLAVLQAIEALQLQPQILHCNDWHTAAIPFLLKTRFKHHPHFTRTRTVLTIHNASFQGVVDKTELHLIPELSGCMDECLLEGYSHLNLLKAGVLSADKINAVSPNYASELLTDLGAHGMAQAFQARQHDLVGILNGCDYDDWDPSNDSYLPANYHRQDLSGKQACKRALQEELGLPVCERPIFGMVARITEQKGHHLLLPALSHFLRHNIQIVIVGTGDPAMSGQLHSLAQRFPDKLKFANTYSNQLAHLVEAGADFFLMPSLFEPCGLNQMYSLAYGTLPIVRGVGGLKDTVLDYDQHTEEANGFVFYEPTSQDLLNTLRRVLLLYLEHPEEIERVRKIAMQTHFYWHAACEHYDNLYRLALETY